MKEEFQIMTKAPLEEYFVKVVIPEIRGIQLRDSRKNPAIGLSPREHLGLVILSFFLRWLNKQETYAPAINNSACDDGAIANTENNQFYAVEQVFIYEGKWDNNVIQGIKDALNKKNKGEQYATGSILLIFCQAQGDLVPNSIKKDLEKSSFESVLIFGPTGKAEFDYNILLAKEKGEIFNSHFILSINPNNGKCFVAQ